MKVFVRPNYCKFNNYFSSAARKPSCASRFGGCAGSSLTEVLVAILVLAVGVIGAAGMQLSAARTAKQSTLQSAALQLASEMGDKIRAHGLNVDKAAGNPFLFVDYDSSLQEHPPAAGKLCYGIECSRAELADFDLYEWLMRIKAELPGGRVRICRDAAPWDEARHALKWDCSPGGGEASPLVIKVGWQAKNPDGSLVRNEHKEFPPLVALTVTSQHE